MPLGVHTSIAGGISASIDRALELGCDALQIFGRNPRSWGFRPLSRDEIALFRSKRLKADIWPVVIHTTYLINLCTPDTANFDKSLYLFKNEIHTAEELGADYLVTHLGSPQEMGLDFAITRINEALKDVYKSGLGKKTMILLENTAGGGYGFGSAFSEIGDIIDNAEEAGLKAGLCFDTCHAFVAGYPMRTPEEASELVRTIDKEAGLKRLKLIHLNDSKAGLNSRLDRHEHIGEGKIGLIGFKAFLNNPKIKPIPLILETPKKSGKDDSKNLKTVRRMLAENA